MAKNIASECFIAVFHCSKYKSIAYKTFLCCVFIDDVVVCYYERDRQPHEGRTLANDILIFISGIRVRKQKFPRDRNSVT